MSSQRSPAFVDGQELPAATAHAAAAAATATAVQLQLQLSLSTTPHFHLPPFHHPQPSFPFPACLSVFYLLASM